MLESMKEIWKDKEKRAHALGTIYLIILLMLSLLWLFGVFIDSEVCDKIIGFMVIANIVIIVLTLMYYIFKRDKICCKAYLKGCFIGYISILKCIFITVLGG